MLLGEALSVTAAAVPAQNISDGNNMMLSSRYFSMRLDGGGWQEDSRAGVYRIMKERAHRTRVLGRQYRPEWPHERTR